MSSSPEEQRELREALAAALQDVAREAAEPIAVLKKRARTMKIVIWTLIWLKALTVTTLVILFITIGNVKDHQSEIHQIQDRTSDKVLCPLYGAFLAAENNPVPKEIAKDPAQVQERKEAFDVIRMGAAELGCKK